MQSIAAPPRTYPVGVRIALLTVMDHGVRYDGGFATETLIGTWRCQFCGARYEHEMASGDSRVAFCNAVLRDVDGTPIRDHGGNLLICGGEHRLHPIDPSEYAARLEVVR